MNFDQERCYCAIETNDETFDGHFVTAVLTTGIYCRPVCRARTPKRENVRFFATAAAAAEAGFRPCLRCRPESAPELLNRHDAVHQLSPLMARALRMISEGALDQQNVDALAQRLHMSTRHLRRSFLDEFGAPPVALAQTRRLLFAKKLIDETSLNMTTIAFSAGYSSIRRFNESIRQTYGRTPSELRNGRRTPKKRSPDEYVQLKLYYCLPYNWERMFGFLEKRALPGVETVAGGKFKRLVKFDDEVGTVEVEPVLNERYCLLRVTNNLSPYLLSITERVKRIFDLKATPEIMTAELTDNDEMASLIAKYPGLRIPGAWDGFELAIRAILGQQISVKAATTFCQRLIEGYGEAASTGAESGLTSIFPTPERLAAADLTEIGLTAKRAETIQKFSVAYAAGDVSFDTAISLDDALEQLTQLPGIGPWTANYIALRALGETDAFPASDLILRRAASPDPDNLLTERELLAKAEAWRPWRGYAAILLWTNYAQRSSSS